MVKRLFPLSLAVTLALFSITCAKLPARVIPSGPTIPVNVMPAIPLDSGELVAVIAHPVDPHWVALWFQKPDKTISIRWVNIYSGNVGSEITIPRK